ncbi:two pore domain potassium channel family protein [Candidatus Woesearchaeota archaeon]|nr:two pore domain potassium channel family protein [Candidatus Woesearchaeota archaeon]
MVLSLVKQFFESIGRALRNHEFMVLFFLVIITLTTGTIFYHRVEDWRYLDSLYYCVITLMTVGYGDFTPKTDAGKIFTIIFLLVGAGIILGFVNVIAEHARNSNRINNIVRKKEELFDALGQKKAEIRKINRKFNKKLLSGNFLEQLDKKAEKHRQDLVGKRE